MFRLVKVNNHRALVFGPILDRTFYLGYHTVDDNIFSYHLNVYREEDGISFCSWSLQFQHQLQARPTLMPAPMPSKSVLTLPLQVEEDEEKTDPKMAMVAEIKPESTIVIKEPVPNFINPKHNRPFQVGDWVKIRDTHSDYRAIFYRPLKQDDERGWFVCELEDRYCKNKNYIEYNSHTAEWEYSDAVRADKSKPKPKTSTAMVVASSAPSTVPTKMVPKKKIVDDEPIVEEVYPLETSTPEPGSSFLSFSETTSDLDALLPVELRPVAENPVKIGPIQNYFPKTVTLSSAKEEFNEHGSIAIRQRHPLSGFVPHVCGPAWTPKAGEQIVIPFKEGGGHWRMTINQDDDGYYIETDDENKISIFFDPERGVWAISELI